MGGWKEDSANEFHFSDIFHAQENGPISTPSKVVWVSKGKAQGTKSPPLCSIDVGFDACLPSGYETCVPES